MNVTGWSRGLEVTGGGRGAHAGLALLRHLADKTGLAGGLSRALATPRILVHDRGRVVTDLACAIADGARVISVSLAAGLPPGRSLLRGPAAVKAGTPGSAAVVEGHLVAVGVGEREGAAERPVGGR